jgi:ribonuclease BN (tRNA processing enzyme)
VRALLLGSGTATPAARAAPGIAIRGAERTLLIDPGPGSTHRLGAAGIAPVEIDDILITHFHPDHVADLVPLLFALRNPRYGSPPRPRVIGPPGLLEFYAGLRVPFGRWLPAAGEGIEIVEVGAGELASGEFRLRGELVQHLPSSLAWRITEKGGATFAYSGDTEPCPGVVRAALGVELLFLECSTPRGATAPGHLNPATASAVIRESGALRTVLVHLSPECDEVDLVGQLDGDVRDRAELGRDGAWYEVGPPRG